MKILIVDDIPDVADSLAMLMNLKGHEVSVRYTAREGICAAKRLRPDAILHDIAMPEMSGYEAIRQIRREPTLKGTFIVAISAFNNSEVRRSAQDAGVDYFLVKPPDLEILLNIIANLGEHASH